MIDLEAAEAIRCPAVGFELDGTAGLDGTKMTAESNALLKKLCKVLRALSEITLDMNLNPPMTMGLTGFTNCAKPADALNKFHVRKSTERARVVAQAAKKFKIGTTKVTIEGAGGTKPIDKDPAVNARVEVTMRVPSQWRDKKRLAVLVYTDEKVGRGGGGGGTREDGRGDGRGDGRAQRVQTTHTRARVLPPCALRASTRPLSLCSFTRTPCSLAHAGGLPSPD